MAAKLSGSYSWPPFVQIPAKKPQRIAHLAHDEGYIVKISPVVTLYFPLVENIQSRFCTARGVLVLVFASQAGKLLFWQRRISFICSVIAEKVMRNGNIWHISVTKLHHCQLQPLTTALTLCFLLIG